jgi:hypothetical protein
VQNILPPKYYLVDAITYIINGILEVAKYNMIHKLPAAIPDFINLGKKIKYH